MAIDVLFQPPDVPLGQQACAWPHRPQFWRPRHHHGELEFNLVHAGRAVFDVGGRPVEVGPGALVWLVPGVHHALIHCSADFDMWVAAFRTEWVDAVAAEPGGSTLRSIIRSSGGLVMIDGAAVHAIGERCRAAFAGQSRLGEAMAPALVLAARASAGGSVAPSMAGRAARKLLDDPNRGRDALRRELRVGTSTLARIFKDELGVGIPEYRARLKLQRALELLGESDEDPGGREVPGRGARQGFAPVAADGSRRPGSRGPGKRLNLLGIALAAGFGSYAQFHRVVTAMTGLSPRALATRAARARLLDAVAVPDVSPCD